MLIKGSLLNAKEHEVKMNKKHYFLDIIVSHDTEVEIQFEHHFSMSSIKNAK
ncbi:MAG TPA: hypothetical protein PKH14_03695 [Syntrophorhabdus sp.]|nr:hypothetical protein [Syntrophorhabdus sp.]